MIFARGGRCKYCRRLLYAEQRCTCEGASGRHWGSGAGNHASPGQENAIRDLEEALSFVDDDLLDQAGLGQEDAPWGSQDDLALPGDTLPAQAA